MKFIAILLLAVLIATYQLNVAAASSVFRAKLKNFGRVKLSLDIDSENILASDAELRWSFRRLIPDSNYSIALGNSGDACAGVESASEALITFETDDLGESSGTATIDVVTTELVGRPISLLIDEDEEVIACKKLKSPKRMRRNKKPSEISVNPSPESKANKSSCQDIADQCGENMKCAMFHVDELDHTKMEPKCVPIEAITCENILCIAEAKCFQLFDEKDQQEPVCIAALVDGSKWAQ
jgi:hypothetical protein